jgi:hypothetical protein
MTTERMSRFDGYAPPARGAVNKILTSADKIAANARVVEEIQALVSTVNNQAVIPSRRIRQILKRHGL